MASAEEGRVIAGKYRLERKLGEGGMGSVWLARHVELHSDVAIKVISPDIADEESILSRFLREARASAALRSPHIIHIYDYGVDEGLAYIVMERLDGESLGTRIERENKLSPALTATVVTHVARGIAKAHEAGIIHRDLKPENIFLVYNDEEVLAKVLDFGIAKALPGGGARPDSSVSSETRTGVLLGSPLYMSPEQAHGRKTIDHRSDLWSVGVIALEALTGVRAFDGTSLGDVVLKICTEPLPTPSKLAEVPPGFDEWFAKAVNRDPDLRFQSARELASALRAVLVPDASAPSMLASQVAARPEEEDGVASTERSLEAAEVTLQSPQLASTTGAVSSMKVSQGSKPPQRPPWVIASVAAAGVITVGAIVLVGLSGSKEPHEETAPVVATPAASETQRTLAIGPTVEPVVAPPASIAPEPATPKPSASTAPKNDAPTAGKPARSSSTSAKATASPQKTPAPKPSATATPKTNLLDVRF